MKNYILMLISKLSFVGPAHTISEVDNMFPEVRTMEENRPRKVHDMKIY